MSSKSSAARRQRWLSVLANAPPPGDRARHGARPHFGTDAPFCRRDDRDARRRRLDSGEVGFGYIRGRDARQAETAAAIRVDFFTVAREAGA